MAKIVGYACALRITWLNMAAEMKRQNLSVDEYKNALNEYLSFEIEKGTVRLRKTRDLLMNIWYYDTEETKDIRSEAMRLLEKYPEYAAAIHLCMIYVVYPVFADICKYMGRLLDFQDDVTNTQLTKKLFDDWGERGTLEATCRRVSLTLKEMGILKTVTQTRYTVSKQSIDPYELVAFLLVVAMRIDKGSYYSFAELKAFYILFPFDFEIEKEKLMSDERFTVTSFGGEITVSLK